MEAAIVDLRYRMKDVLQALERNEEVKVLYRGRVKGTIVPAGNAKSGSVSEHPLFGSVSDAETSVDEEMEELRGGRCRDI